MLQVSESFVGRLEMNGMFLTLQYVFGNNDSMASELVKSARLIYLRKFFAKDIFFDEFVKKSILWLSKETKNFEKDVYVEIPISFEKIFISFSGHINRLDAELNSVGIEGYFRSFGQEEKELFLCFVQDIASGWQEGLKVDFKEEEIKKKSFLF